MRKEHKFPRARFNDNEMSTFSYGICLTVETVKDQIYWDMWRNLILLTLNSINLWIYLSNPYNLLFWSKKSTFFSLKNGPRTMFGGLHLFLYLNITNKSVQTQWDPMKGCTIPFTGFSWTLIWPSFNCLSN